MATVAPPIRREGGHLKAFGREYVLVGPSLRDSRLHVAATLLTVQVLGQTVIEWDLSITQILLCFLTCLVIEVCFVAWRDRIVAWPASAMLTANGVALLLRVPGTEHGDWWSANGGYIFVAVSAFAVLTKYAIRVAGRPLFNPSNLGLVAFFLLLGSERVDPQDFWWGPWSVGLAVTYAVILTGGIMVTRRLRVLGPALVFWGTLALALGIVAVSGHAITARWHLGLLQGTEWWWVVVSSPETLIFLFFMITDPKTIPEGRSARFAFAGGVGLLGAAFAAPQTTEFATKVAILAGLTIMCAFRPVLELLLPTVRSDQEPHRSERSRPGPVASSILTCIAIAGVAALLVTAGGPSRNLLTGHRGGSDRPEVAVGDVPPISIDANVDGVDAHIDQGDADAMARDLVEDLALEAEAIRLGDPHVAELAASGVRLESLLLQVEAGGPVSVPRYRFDALRLFLHRDLAEGQAAPRLGVEASGVVRRDTAVQGRVVPGGTEPFDAVFLLTEFDGHWLIDDQRPAAA